MFGRNLAVILVMEKRLNTIGQTDTTTIRVLLVEDDPIARLLMTADFRKHAPGFELTAVPGLSEGFRLLHKDRFDVILLDLFLEETAGLETLFKVREVVPEIPVVVLTGLDDEAQALQALKHGAQDYFIKGSIDTRTLVRAIRYAIERKQAETNRRSLEERLIQTQKLEAVGTLAAGVAHNFNNKLMVILGYSNLLLEQGANDDGRPHVEAIKKAAEQAAALTRQLLIFSKNQSDTPTLLNLSKTVLDMQALLESTLNDGIRLVLKLEQDLRLVKANASQFRQVLMNLVMNSRNAMTSGGQITIETVQRDERVILMVTDTGCGMSPETLPHIFEPFFTTRDLSQASGLGLSTVYGIVKQHGGNIEVSSEPGKGTTFSIDFPALCPAKLDESNQSEAQQTRATIMVVAEEKNAGEFLLETLDGAKQYMVLGAGDWHEAIEVVSARETPIDLLVAETVNHAAMRPHLVKRLVDMQPGMKIVYVSGGYCESMTERGLLPEGTHLPETELTRETLLSCVEKVLARPGTARAKSLAACAA